jgi:cell division protein FtsQ
VSRRPFDGELDATEGREEPMDPRVAARLADVAAVRREEEVRARRRRSLLVLGAFVLVAGLLGLVLSPVLGAHHVRVAGIAHTRKEDVVAASHLDRSDALVRVSTGSVARRVEALPWVEKARVSRQWPRTVRISITERKPAAVAPCGEGTCLVDASGRVLARAATAAGDRPDAPPASEAAVDPGDLPVIANVDAAGLPGTTIPPSARPALAVALALPASLRPIVLAVRGNGPLVEIALKVPGRERNPPIIRLGDATRIPDKLTAAATVLASRGTAGLAGVEIVDVRVPEAPTLTSNNKTT